MAKRFTDTEKWNKRFVRQLKPHYKLFWLYLLDECNNAGIWEVDFEVANLKLGIKIIESEAFKIFNDKVVKIDNGTKWFIPAFIEFQYGELSENNRAHTKIIFLLKKFNLINEELKPLASPLQAPIQGAKEEDKVVGKEMEEDKDKGGQKIETLVYPFTSESFLEAWAWWKKYKKEEHKFSYKSKVSEQGALQDLSVIAKGDESKAIAVIHQSISKGWKGFFELQTNQNATSKAGQPNTTTQGIINAIDAMYSTKQP